MVTLPGGRGCRPEDRGGEQMGNRMRDRLGRAEVPSSGSTDQHHGRPTVGQR
ncbi:hypothetical protein KTR9_3688 [Gordonia sp. KTR9]|nr:hypothetical protein KTR9_3688 [Gordonia sp. KTR9]